MTDPGRALTAVRRAAPVSVAGHLAVAALFLFAADDLGGGSDSTAFRAVAVFAAVGAAATLLAWAAASTAGSRGRTAWSVAFTLVLASALAVAVVVVGAGSIAMLVVPGVMLLVDLPVLTRARQALDGGAVPSSR